MTAKTRTQGTIETLPSDSLRVKVYAGRDPLTKKRLYLTEVVVVPEDASAKDLRQAHNRADQIRAEFAAKVDARRNPRTSATVNELRDRYLDPTQTRRNVEPSTHAGDVEPAERHIRPLIGHVKVAALDASVFDSFYAQLQTCRRHCRDATGLIDHRTPQRHQCDRRCVPHNCRPLAGSTINRIHGLLSGALKRAVRWKWIAVNPIGEAEPPTPAAPTPSRPHRRRWPGSSTRRGD